MATTTNFGWVTPDDTSLVKDGAAAIRTLGQSIDTSMMDLEGGTTGQVLSKASNTDMDFTWVTTDDTNAIQNAIVDAKGDLIAATAADTPARLAVGTNGQVLTADSTAATGLAWATAASTGGWTSLGSGSLASNILTISSISSAYKDLRLVIKNFQVATTADVILNANSSTNIDVLQTRATGTSAALDAVVASANWYLSNSVVATGSNSNIAVLDFLNYAETTGYKMVRYNGRIFANAQSQQFSVSGAILSTSAISSIVFKTSGPNFAGGTYEIWGIK
jgi:hypothetical protein